MALTRRILTLPDIDHSGKEVFETSDEDECVPPEQPESFRDNDIDTSRFDRAAAMAKFVGKVIPPDPSYTPPLH